MNRKKFLILDANSIINRAFYGIRLLTTKDGIYTNAVYGFLNILFKYKEEIKPDYIAAAFDLPAPTFRHKKYEGYKATRKKMPEELAVQLPILKEVLECMNIPILEKEGFEADDIIGTVSGICENKDIECCILTGDKDDLQLATEHNKIYLVTTRMGNTETEVFDRDKVIEKYGVTPQEFIEVKSIMGDPSDNIPGIRGIGEKGALSLIIQYKNLENIYENIDNIKGALKNKLEEGKEIAFLSRTLSAIDKNVPLGFSASDAVVKSYNEEKLAEIFKRLEFKSFLKKLSLKEAGTPAQSEVLNTEYKELSCEKDILKYLSSGNDCCYIIDRKENKFYISFDETLCCGVDINEETIPYLKKLFEDEDIKKTTHNLKEDIIYLSGLGIDTRGEIFDTAIAAYLLEPSRKNYELNELCFDFLGISLLESGTCSKQLSFEEDSNSKAQMYTYTSALWKLKAYEMSELIKTNEKDLFNDIEMPLVCVLASMQMYGIEVDRGRIEQFGAMLTGKINVLTNEIYELAGSEFNINSPKQLGDILYKDLGLSASKKTKTGFSTNAEALDRLLGVHPIIEKILEYRQLTKLKSTYVDGLTNEINKKTGRIHSNFNQTVTITGRISSTEPNLQNIPIRTELGREMRKMFVAADGFSFVDADYSQIELRVLAHIAGDENMISAFSEGQDIHASTASRIFDVPQGEVTHEMRTAAKAINFGLVYGKGEFSLANDLKISVKSAKNYIDEYLGSYPMVQKYMKDIISFAHENGYVTTMFGRRRIINEISSKNYQLRSFGERAALNTPIQGSAADIIKLAMVRVYKELKRRKLKSRLILQVHDELIVEAADNELDQVKEILKEQMENVCKMRVLLTVDMNVGKNWYETK